MKGLKVIFIFSFFILSFFNCLEAFAQKKAKKDSIIVLKDSTGETLIINKLKYRTKNRWFTGGAGWNFGPKGLDGNLGLDYHFYIKKINFQVGLLRGKEYDGFFPVEYDRVYNEFHICYGYKFEKVHKLYQVFFGPSFIYGDKTESDGIPAGFSSLGLQGNFKYILKPVYDIGIGVEVFADLNFKYSFAGTRIILFFSNAYKGKKR